MDILSFAGSVASIGGAIVSVISAVVAYKIKTSIIEKMHSSDISELRAIAKIASIQVNKICQPTAKLRGVNIPDIITSLQQVQSSINENKDILKKYKFINLESTARGFKTDISELNHEEDKANISAIGERLLDTIQHIVSELSRISRSKIER
jgi:hypothetical protein